MYFYIGIPNYLKGIYWKDSISSLIFSVTPSLCQDPFMNGVYLGTVFFSRPYESIREPTAHYSSTEAFVAKPQVPRATPLPYWHRKSNIS